MSSTPAAATRAPIYWPATVMFAATTAAALVLTPIYVWTRDFDGFQWAWFVVLWLVTGMSITAGYHRLWAHRAYEAAWPIRVLYMLFGAMALQNSILIWCSGHRNHHKDVDDPARDPYSARLGLWFSHIGWMLRDYPSGKVDFANARDLQADPIVMFQHRHYLGLALGMNLGVPLLLGLWHGDVFGCLLLPGLLRLVAVHHATFFINSLAHYWGRQPYSAEHTARDNDFLSLLTYGEGYHNFHHSFQWDYRNGIRWWQFDPTKWWIAACARLRLARNLRRTPEFQIQRARVERQLERARERLAACRNPGRLETLQRLLEQEMQALSATLGEWTALQQERFEAARQKLLDQWENSDVRRRFQALEEALRLQYERVRLLQMQAA